MFCIFFLAHFIVKPIREGDFIIQPKVDFDIGVSTVAGLLNLGYASLLFLVTVNFACILYYVRTGNVSCFC